MKNVTLILIAMLGSLVGQTAYAQNYKDLADVGPGVPVSKENVAHVSPTWDEGLDEAHFAKAVKRGYSYFVNTQQLKQEGFTNNGLNCVNCHLSAGKKAGAAPMWAAYVSYPAWRGKNKKVNTYSDRLQGCFMYSMNAKGGLPPEASSEIILDLTAYSYWLATDAKINSKIAGRSFPAVDKPKLAPDFKRGGQVYANKCAMCHGDNGEGRKVEKQFVFPALWGKESYNWGAGMHKVATATNFIKANMPLSQGNTLTDQEAWDVAYFINTHERPQDPRFKGNLKETASKFHASGSEYGKPSPVDQHILGSKAY